MHASALVTNAYSLLCMYRKKEKNIVSKVVSKEDFIFEKLKENKLEH